MIEPARIELTLTYKTETETTESHGAIVIHRWIVRALRTVPLALRFFTLRALVSFSPSLPVTLFSPYLRGHSQRCRCHVRSPSVHVYAFHDCKKQGMYVHRQPTPYLESMHMMFACKHLILEQCDDDFLILCMQTPVHLRVYE